MKTPVIAGAPMFKLMIGRRVKVMVPSLKVASDVFQRVRDESGEGCSTFPDGVVTADDGAKYRISYNGRVWNGQTIVTDAA